MFKNEKTNFMFLVAWLVLTIILYLSQIINHVKVDNATWIFWWIITLNFPLKNQNSKRLFLSQLAFDLCFIVFASTEISRGFTSPFSTLYGNHHDWPSAFPNLLEEETN
ncbi:hypothetical protein [Streptococcus pluranimalium]|uniref:hypothetical protein n=1 Tax=Streptococcus pluranimalium TaxID=82348 RepID=UPI003F690006